MAWYRPSGGGENGNKVDFYVTAASSYCYVADSKGNVVRAASGTYSFEKANVKIVNATTIQINKSCTAYTCTQLSVGAIHNWNEWTSTHYNANTNISVSGALQEIILD